MSGKGKLNIFYGSFTSFIQIAISLDEDPQI